MRKNHRIFIAGLSILKTADEKCKRSSPYPNLVAPLPLEGSQNPQNVVKVQPNNFLIETTQKPVDDVQVLADLIEFEDNGGLRNQEEDSEKSASDKRLVE